jgi:hypothetical protein
MATLSLKKPKKIGDTPLPDLQSKFVVMRQARGFQSFRFTCIHDTQELASREARRLCKISPSERFLVLEIVDSVDWSQ